MEFFQLSNPQGIIDMTARQKAKAEKYRVREELYKFYVGCDSIIGVETEEGVRVINIASPLALQPEVLTKMTREEATFLVSHDGHLTMKWAAGSGDLSLLLSPLAKPGGFIFSKKDLLAFHKRMAKSFGGLGLRGLYILSDNGWVHHTAEVRKIVTLHETPL